MTGTFRIELYNQHGLSDPGTMDRLWRRLRSPLIEPTKFDFVERARRDFRPDASGEAAELFDQNLRLFVHGANNGFLAHFTEYTRNLSVWTLRVHGDAIAPGGDDGLLEWLFELCADLPVLFGLGCTAEEYEAKHATGRVASGGIAVRGAKGVSVADFRNFLPGTYWLTIFGPELVRGFGAERIDGLTDVRTERIGEDQIAVILDEPPVPDDMEARLGREAELAEALGAEFFFDRERDPSELRQVPELSEALEANDG